MKNLIIISYLCCTCLSSAAQICVQDYVFSTQLEIDAFAIDNSDCSIIDGSVILLGTVNGSDIVDLSALDQIDIITGDLEIKLCNQLTSIESLNGNLLVEGNTTISDNFNLEEILLNINTSATSNIEITRNNNLNYIFVGNQIDSLNNMVIVDNQNLNLIEGFIGLEYIQEELFFLDNVSLLNIPSFNTAKYIHNVRLIGNDNLVEIDGFNHLDSVFNVVLVPVPSLRIFKGFNNVTLLGSLTLVGVAIEEIDIFRNTETAGAIGIQGIIQEESITLFNKLTSIGSNLNIIEVSGGAFNSFLNLESVGFNRIEVVRCNFEHLDFLSNVKSVTGFKPYFRIQGNPNLSDISGLDGIESDSIHWFNVRQNPNLSICHTKLVCDVLERGDNDPPSVWIDNGSGCNSTEEILEQCAEKPDEPEDDPTLCPIASRPGMQIDRVDDSYNIMYHYGIKRMYLREIAYAELVELIEYHKVQKDILFDFDTFTLEQYCEQAEVISKGEAYVPNMPTDPMMEYKVETTLSEIDFFQNFVLTIGSGECVKL